jgi:hypothetical protein
VDKLVEFLTPFVPGSEIVRGQVDRVPMPRGDCVVITEQTIMGLSRPRVKHDADNQLDTITAANMYDFQIDFYSDFSGGQADAVRTVIMSGAAWDKFPTNIKPLTCSDGMQSPLAEGEQQYGQRWTITISMQYNPVVTIPQQSAIVVSLNSMSAI